MKIDLLPSANSRWNPDADGRFGEFGGQFVPETLMAAVLQLQDVYAKVRVDQAFWENLHTRLVTYVGRPARSTTPRD